MNTIATRTRTPSVAQMISSGLLLLLLLQTAKPLAAFQQHRFSISQTTRLVGRTKNAWKLSASSSDNNNNNGQQSQPYVRMTESTSTKGQKKAILPQVGDVVRYYDLDGGNANGQVLVGKISYVFGSMQSGFSVELNELEDVGDGYFAEYSSALRSRKGRKTERRLEQVSPLAASFVGVEQAYKVPIDASTGLPRPRQESYDLEEYEGPVYGNINQDVLATDAENYAALKAKLFRNVALTGLVGTIIANASYGPELAIIYFAGSLASLLYLILLSVKTDTVAVNKIDNSQNLAGTPIANLRFGAPVLVLIGVSIYNAQKMSSGLGGGDDEFTMQLFDTVSREQFAAAVLGFLTYRLPLFVGQIRDAFQQLEAETAAEESGIQLPGSAGVAAKLLGRGSATEGSSADAPDLVTVLLISGPQATGRSELVQKLLESTDKPLVPPKLVLRQNNGETFERLERRGEFLDSNDTSGLTAEGIVNAAKGLFEGKEIPNSNVVVVDASVELAKKLTQTRLPGNTRLIGVWVGLNSVQDFERRLEADIEAGNLVIPSDETKESFLRGKIKDIVNEIDFGLGARIFEFTILNDTADPDKSLKELNEAASYAFK